MTTARRLDGGSIGRTVAIATAVAFLGLFVAQWLQLALSGQPVNWATDYDLYHEAAARWLGGGSFYLDRQLHGPYDVIHGDVLYPPPILVLLVPFSILPPILWWAIPLAIVAAVCVWHRPRPLAWAVIAFAIWFPITGVKLIHGNPGMWVMAFLALGTVFGWPSVLVLLKPTLAPFALVGSWTRGWWVALGVLLVVSLPFLPMWPTYVRVLLDARSTDGPLYSLNEVLMTAVPVIAWLGSTRQQRKVALPERPAWLHLQPSS